MMERLTYDFCIGDMHCWQVKGADNLTCKEVCLGQDGAGCKGCPISKAFDRLAAYEGTIPLERAQEFAQVEKDGRLVVLQNGATVCYLQEEYRKAKHMAEERLPSPDYTTGCIAGFGAGVIYILDKILTREEAEAALKKRGRET